MNQSKETKRDRLPFFDNVRSLMVLFVLIFHSGASYSSKVAFWPFHEEHPSIFIDLFMFLGDVFMMAVLFFIAGYFALASVQKRGGWDFLKSKLKRLGIPWFIVTIFVLPALDYLHYSVQSLKNGLPVWSYGIHWLLSMKKIGEFHVGWMNMSSYLNLTEHFYQRYMWFLSLLLLFFAIYALMYTIQKKLNNSKKSSVRDEIPSKKSIYSILTVVGFLTVLLFAGIRFYVYPDFKGMGWFSLGNLIQFQFGKLAIYATYFGLGCYAYSRKWFTNYTDFGKPWVWGLICFCLFGANIFILKNLSTGDLPDLGLRLGFVVLYPLWTLSFLGLFISFAARHWNRSTSFNRDWADNSYNMYLAHYIFPMTLPLLLSLWGGPTMAKFGIVAMTTVLSSYVISRYILKQFPKFVITVIIGFSVVLAVVT